MIDISEEVGGWRNHGLNGFALDPDFLSNGFIYLFILWTGSPDELCNNASTNEYYNATIARVTRYTANPAAGFTTLLSAGRFVLIGENNPVTCTNGHSIINIPGGTGQNHYAKAAVKYVVKVTNLNSCSNICKTGSDH